MAFVIRSLGSVVRGFGKALDQTGLGIQGKNGFKERLAVHAQTLAIDNKKPTVHSETFIAPNSSLIGNVTLASRSSVFYSSILKGENNSITVGDSTTIGDHVTITASKNSVKIGSKCFIGSGSTLTDCTVNDGAHIGLGCVILEGAVIESDAILAPGTFVPANTRVTASKVWSGYPAQLVRPVEKDEQEQFSITALSYPHLGQIHALECSKPFSQVEAETEAYHEEWRIDPDHVTSLKEFAHVKLLPQLENYLYPLQIRTYFEVDKAVPIDPESIIYINENQDPKKVMEEVLAAEGHVGEEMGDFKKSYWYVG
eukprot:c36790_g1_i1.p1 GENE.c36790_g1_i1~~c36790_g1_i1.p1  ORF type:complete len:313 (+),score=102.09 c36790_g1_i1:35-973(+)